MNADKEYQLTQLKITVRTMREKQKTYFATRSPMALKDSKELEKRVDRLLEEIG